VTYLTSENVNVAQFLIHNQIVSECADSELVCASCFRLIGHCDSLRSEYDETVNSLKLRRPAIVADQENRAFPVELDVDVDVKVSSAADGFPGTVQLPEEAAKQGTDLVTVVEKAEVRCIF
jgi:hypothetical protein